MAGWFSGFFQAYDLLRQVAWHVLDVLWIPQSPCVPLPLQAEYIMHPFYAFMSYWWRPSAPHHYHHHPFHRPVKWYHTVQLTQSHSSHCSFYPAPPGTAVAGAETPPENLAENAAMPSGDTLQPDCRLVSSVFSASQSGRMPWDFPQALTGSMLWVKPWSRGDNQRRIMTWWFRL